MTRGLALVLSSFLFNNLNLNSMYSINNTDTVTIQLKEGKPMYHRKEVILPEMSLRLLRGQGEGGSVVIRKTNLKYKKNGTNNH